ncbi:hypothetical protein ACFV0C_22375 [Streptomyces sp. NPDC059568]|uniref:hypothetical protein n=1 Tax=Streptomyces sp. NPDC059568 TaxID=3346868 RepID=UPI0036CED8EF
MTSALVFAGGAAFAGTVSTALSNGRLSLSADDGCVVTGNCNVYYSVTSYTKTGGSTVDIRLAIDTGNSLYKTDLMSISSGQTKSKSWGALRKSDAEGCSVAGYMNASTGNYYTPNLQVC